MRLKHSGVVQCLGAITNQHQIVLDWMQNGEIMNYLRKNPGASRVNLVSPLVFTTQELRHPMSRKKVQVLGVTKALDYLHSHEVIHGDVKPVGIPFGLLPAA